jgi:hypothetical protein
MHYSRAALTNKTGTPNPNAPDPTIDTIDPTAAYVAFLNIMGSPYNRILSKLDRSGMAQIYGNPSASPSALVTNTKDGGPGSLRTAIYYAFDKSTDAPPVPTTVTFHIPTSDPNYNAASGVFTIKPTFILTAPGAGTTIDGSTQTSFTGDTNPNGPEIVTDGSQIALENLSLLAPGLLLREANCTIKNLVINGFNQEGIAIDGTRAALFGTAATGNVISGCYIGTDKNGTTGIGNGNMFAGIIMFGGAHNNTVGGTTTTARNVISGSTGYGISIQDAGSNNNVIEGNFIGLNATGTGVLSNAFHGVAISGGAQNNIVGTTTPGAGNVISGNTIDGVFITGANTNNNVVQGNLVGLNANGSAGAPNGGAGVDVANGPQSTIVGPGNVVSGNAASGVIVNAVNGTMVQGNYIGTNPGGTIAIPNSQAGVYIAFGAQNTAVGGTATAARNIISGNTGDGIDLNNVSNTTVRGNYIGVDVTGAAAMPNGTGIALFSGSTSNTIGGTAPGARNIISGNIGDGLNLNGVSATTIQGNYIGLDFTGVVKIGNGGSGVDLFGAATSTAIGGTAAGARNFISGSASAGVAISGAGTNGNVVQGNTIGMNVAGTVVANGQQGIALFGGAQSNTIGGSTIGASNIISGNTAEAVALFDSTTNNNAVSQNSIFSNHFRGIGVYTNSNNNQAAPTLNSAVLSTATNPSGTDVAGSLTSTASSTFRIEFFASPSGGDEGQFFIGSANVTTDAGGSFLFNNSPAHPPVSLTSTVPAGYVITATATDPNENTSQFSSTQTVTTTDTDGDGIPDNWMNAHFSHPTGQIGDKSRATDDADGDGTTNLQEFKAGTDPKSATSRFRISSIVPNAGNYQIGFPSVLGKTYRLEYRDDLVTGNWTTLTDQIFGTGATIQINDPSAAGLSKRFYRLSLEP